MLLNAERRMPKIIALNFNKGVLRKTMKNECQRTGSAQKIHRVRCSIHEHYDLIHFPKTKPGIYSRADSHY